MFLSCSVPFRFVVFLHDELNLSFFAQKMLQILYQNNLRYPSMSVFACYVERVRPYPNVEKCYKNLEGGRI